MKIELFLAGNPVEINKDIDFVLNKQFTDLTDLTSIIVDYSKTIKVPMTPKNNDLFNYVYKLEHQAYGVTYNPAQKIPMTMCYNGAKVLEGYALLKSVNLKDKTYEIGLYGQMGKIFSMLKERTLANYHTESNGFWKTVRMNTKAVKDSIDNWSWDLDWSSTDWTDFWGLTPQMIGKSDLIDTTKFEAPGTVDYTDFEEDINTARSITYADLYVKDGLDFNQYLEARSYMCRPYVYVNKLVQLVQAEINNSQEFDGYSLVLDPDWFNNQNPYYQDLCYFPGTESPVDSGEGTNGQVTWKQNELNMGDNGGLPYEFLPTVDTNALDGYTYSTSGNTITLTNSVPGQDTTATMTLKANSVMVRDRVTGVLYVGDFNTRGRWAYYNLAVMNIIPIRYIGVYDSNDNLIYKLYLCDNEIHSVYDRNHTWAHTTIKDVWATLKKLGPKVVVPESAAWMNGSLANQYCEVTQYYDFGDVVLNTNSFKFKIQCDFIDFWRETVSQENISWSSYESLYPFYSDKYKSKVWTSGATFYGYFKPIQALEVSSNNYRSGSYWTIKDVLGNDFNPFLWLINYVKKFRLFFDIDYISKTITLKGNYFDTVTYKDVTVDYSKDMKVDPVVDEYKRVIYGYRENESRKGTIYNKKYGVEYGDKEYDTRLDINDETMELSPDKEEGVFIPVIMNALTYRTLKSPHSVLRYTNDLGTSKVITTLTADGDLDYFPFYAFRDNNAATTYTWYISDDSGNQKNTGSYAYLDHTNNALNPGWETQVQYVQDGQDVLYLQPMNYIPQFDNYMYHPIVEGGVKDYLWWHTFGTPREVYNDYLPSNIECRDVLSYRWNRWLYEVFSPHNKKVTCYVRMSYPEFINFKFNQLWVIDHCVFLVNKIIDFNPNQVGPTKVELVQISDVDNLK